MKKWLSLLIVLVMVFLGVGRTYGVIEASIGAGAIQERSYSHIKIVNFTLNSNELLVEHVTPTGNSCMVEYYGCSVGSAHVTIQDHHGQNINGFTVPYIGYTTCYVNISCTANQQLTFIITPLSNSPAHGGFKIHY